MLDVVVHVFPLKPYHKIIEETLRKKEDLFKGDKSINKTFMKMIGTVSFQKMFRLFWDSNQGAIEPDASSLPTRLYSNYSLFGRELSSGSGSNPKTT